MDLRYVQSILLNEHGIVYSRLSIVGLEPGHDYVVTIYAYNGVSHVTSATGPRDANITFSTDHTVGTIGVNFPFLGL